jgi:hypothetical protein
MEQSAGALADGRLAAGLDEKQQRADRSRTVLLVAPSSTDHRGPLGSSTQASAWCMSAERPLSELHNGCSRTESFVVDDVDVR